MLNRFSLLSIAFAFMFLAACGGSKGSGAQSYSGSDDDASYSAPPPNKNELKEAHDDAVSLTEENHKLAKEVFDLKNKLGLPTDE
ncbi:hypothetical protein AGMMS49938_18160 [Fibrobacterales bacterium]|nr:hypothetical protein AGMMS49938_18160 [Fibrobacterales bacterium]